jgi:hypothetical protein
MPDLEERISHLDSQGLSFITSGHGTTIIIGKHYHRFSNKVGTKHPLAGHKEIIAIG